MTDDVREDGLPGLDTRRFKRLVPPGALEVMARLEAAGHQAYLVGGCVRDLVMDRRPHDWDVATDARPAQVRRLFPRVRPTGVRHGTVTVVTPTVDVEVTTFRVEGPYSDRRRPDHVTFVARIEDDLARRDFTINAMAADARGRLVDPFGGRRDLFLHRLVRAVGDPAARFSEDALRMLRAVRLAAELGLDVEQATYAAIAEHAHLLEHVSAERIRDEFSRILLARRPDVALERLRETGLLRVFLPELLEGVGFAQNIHHAHDVWTHLLLTTRHVPARLDLRLAALFHDIAKPRTASDQNGERHFFHHERVGAEIAASVLKRLRFDNRVTERVTHLVRHHMALHYQPGMTDAAVRRLIGRIGLEWLEDLLVLRRADRIASGKKRGPVSRGTRRLLEHIERVLQEDAAFSLKDLAIDGHDVMRIAGIGPGPEVGRILKACLEAVLEDPERNTPEALAALVQALARPESEAAAPGAPAPGGSGGSPAAARADR